MADAPLPLASAFAPEGQDAWEALVAKTLKGAGSETLRSRTVEGLVVEPLYRPANAPGVTAARRDGAEPGDGWDLRAEIAHCAPAQANAEALDELAGGAASLVLRIDPTGASGVAIASAERLERVLSGVVLELATVALDAGFLGLRAAEWLFAAAKGSPGARLAFNLSPISAFAEAGSSPGPIEAHVDAAAAFAARAAETYPGARVFLADGRVVHEAGGGEGLEIAFAAASAVAYARAMLSAGFGAEEAFSRISLGLSVDADYFLSIAKLRAARQVFDRIAEASGAATGACLDVRSSRRMIAARDPWTNMLRLTQAGFAAAVGGADAVTLGRFTDALGRPTAFARRQSRNIQHILREEAGLGRVADPAAGAWYVEALTRSLAERAWADFQAIEAAGGLLAALKGGAIADQVAAARAAREAAVRDKSAPIVGVTIYPNPDEGPVPVEPANPADVAAEAPPTRLPGADSTTRPLTPERLAAQFEEALG